MKTGIEKLQVIVHGMSGSPLVIHCFAEKAKKEMRDNQQKKAKKAKEARDPEQEFRDSKYIDENGNECAPITAIKKSIVTAVTAMDGLKKVAMRQAVFCYPTVNKASMLIPILKHDGTPAVGEMREDAVTIAMGKRNLAYRPEYKEWRLDFTVEYNSTLVSKEQVIALITHAGWGVGICEGRPEKTSALGWGRFEVYSAE